MLEITYNYNLFVTLFASYMFLNGMAHVGMSVTHDGEPRMWKRVGVWDGLVMMAICTAPLFF